MGKLQRLRRKNHDVIRKKEKSPFLSKIVFWGSMIWLVYIFTNYFVENNLLEKKGVCTKGVIYDKTWTKNSSFVYRFLANNREKYDGYISTRKGAKMGDTICVVYLESSPSVNRPLSFFDKGEIKCDCSK